ncbi:carbamoyl-phosphate synthase large subunit [Bradyrhizobium sp. CCBAU 11386]|uniref:acetyl-CoA carboxylase family protein n=1 Tax=Bradyrhizobium sp. CCBAU 11386 TaxID=1630837 RepID=UPI002302F44E|nr:carboxyl transferase domain-containing protein [Bradyrhizobium sp. CCBAU 11386]MDA9504846.1 carbamoyl-phosphate synthase large subunit [Bradyrhizobium sp. CCBAU 11386]
MKKLFIANRAEIAIRIARTAADLGIETFAVFADDDCKSLHVKVADGSAGLGSEGAAAYLDWKRMLDVALQNGCDSVHPGYGFLSENPAFAAACEKAGVTFVGPTAATLSLFGDKAAARRAAEACDAPLLPGVNRAVTYPEAREFFESLGPGLAVMLKAVAGGGGRGMRPVSSIEDLCSAFERCSSEAVQAFGSGDLYVEEFFPRARHIEVQIIGDGRGGVAHLWDRECSLQRQRQKVMEIAPAFGLQPEVREQILGASVRIAKHAKYRGLCTMEFLVDARPGSKKFVFIEANPRIQVEHTVTEEVLGLDLVAAQLKIADGATLADLQLIQEKVPSPSGFAIQARVNMERMTTDGTSVPTGGIIDVYEPPAGPGVRVDGFGYAGYETSVRYDSLLAKVVAHGPDLTIAIARARRALSEFRIDGVSVNLSFLQALLKSTALSVEHLHTRYIDEHIKELIAQNAERPRYFSAAGEETLVAGADVDLDDPLAVLAVRPGRTETRTSSPRKSRKVMLAGPPGCEAVAAPMQGTVVVVHVQVGDEVRQGQTVAVLEALKMEYAITASTSGIVREIVVTRGTAIQEGAPLLFLEPAEVAGAELVAETSIDLDFIGPDLARVQHFHALTRDDARAEATAKRKLSGKRTARENIEDLCDRGTFLEYGPLVTTARQHNESRDQLEARLRKAPGDGMVMGIGRVNGALFGPQRSRCVALSYDYTVFAGTQGGKGHDKTDRMLEVAEQQRLPVVFFTEGGGGRAAGYPGDPPPPPAYTGGLKFGTWRHLGKLSGLVPLVGITSGRCFAGNALLLALCDIIIATRDSTIGIGGPAMIEGGGLGRYTPEEVGPVDVQEPNGVIDVVVEDEAEAVAVAKRYLSYFQGPVTNWTAPDQRSLRHMIPQNRRSPYDIRKIIATIADEGSMLELRRRFGLAMVTAFIRVQGRTVGVIANNCTSPTGGAVDSDAADKAARFMQLCDAFDIPILSMLDVPGNMVGPEAERTATVRHCGRLYVTGANVTVPMFGVVLRKAYGLGALAMTGGGFHVPSFVVSWPTGEFADMGLEGRVKLERRAELAAIENISERKARYEELVARAYDWASAVNGATVFEFDDVIDPADTRQWIIMGLEAAPLPVPRAGKKVAFVDTW